MFNKTALSKITDIIDLKSENIVSVVIGIDGLAGAGKSTLAKQIVHWAGNAKHIELDDFYQPYQATKDSRLSPKEMCFRLFDWKRFRNDLLIPIAQGHAAIYQRYGWVEDRLLDHIEIPVAPVIVVEGVFSMLPSLRSFYDLKIYIDTPKIHRLNRINARGYLNRGWMDLWMAAEDWYIDEIKPKDHVDLVIPGASNKADTF